ncbi:MAG: hypothetical protein ABJA35_14090 [Parafilimonas sp.]
MKASFLVFALIGIFSCNTKNSNESISVQTDTTVQTNNAKEDTSQVQSQPLAQINDTLKIILKTKSIPGDVDKNVIKQLPEPLKALTAFYAAMGGSNCNGDSCELTTSLALGKQGSDAQKSLITNYFPNDKVAELVVSQDCYLPPSGASSFSDFQYLNLINLGDTVKVDYSLMLYNHGKTDFKKGPDIYLFQDNKFTKLKRNIWESADK